MFSVGRLNGSPPASPYRGRAVKFYILDVYHQLPRLQFIPIIGKAWSGDKKTSRT